MERLTVEINGIVYNDLSYNEQTGYFEKEIHAPLIGGMYNVNVSYIDFAGNLFTNTRLLQVLNIMKNKQLANEFVGYFFDKNTFKITDVIELQDYETVIDEETNGVSTFSVMQKLNANEGDIIFVKESNNWIYYGVLNSPEKEEKETKTTFTAKYITNLFDRRLILKNESLISTTGIEDFIKYTIENEFTKNKEDPILNMKYIDIEVKTHTKVQKSVDTEDGLYYFHTYMTNATQLYNINYRFEIKDHRLNIIIEKLDEAEQILDCNVDDITNYLEVFENKVTAKVIVLSKESGKIYNLYLRTDRTTTTNKDDTNRAIGKIHTITVEEDSDMQQAAVDVFKGNSYNHLISFLIDQLCKLYDVENWHVGKPFVVKSKNGIILSTYISSIVRKQGQRYIDIKLGNIRTTYLEKINKEREGRK